jgi:hypothetical protein
MKPRISKSMPQHTPRKRPGMDAGHLANIRSLPCAACNVPTILRSHAHHLLRTDERGLSRKSSDRWAIPLCIICHDHLHMDGDEEGWLARRGVDGRALAKQLWSNRGNIDEMQRVLFRARQAAQLSANALSVRTNA